MYANFKKEMKQIFCELSELFQVAFVRLFTVRLYSAAVWIRNFKSADGDKWVCQQN